MELIFNSKNYLFTVVNLPAIKKAYRPATNKEQWAEGKGWHVFHRGRLFLELRPKCTRIACYSPSDRLTICNTTTGIEPQGWQLQKSIQI